MKFHVIRQHFGDKMYMPGDTREANESDVKHLIGKTLSKEAPKAKGKAEPKAKGKAEPKAQNKAEQGAPQNKSE